MLRVAPGELEVFDSLATNAEFIKKTIPYQGKCVFNTQPVQEKRTFTCGPFCLYFLVNRLTNLDLEFSEFLDEFFEESRPENEKIVASFMKSNRLGPWQTPAD